MAPLIRIPSRISSLHVIKWYTPENIPKNFENFKDMKPEQIEWDKLFVSPLVQHGQVGIQLSAELKCSQAVCQAVGRKSVGILCPAWLN